ncbi:MAG: ATP synthase F1 subunit delta [Deltaproteobacteria bacterium CG11_big_fil_rev_8_21_14_0_20_47_16]|nr:MAG: ATP synthase F1 subunit delta [Deltaproteobacteria bacterium CG11_big_fil_rev_8_21_14_0_20_47_16]
MSDTVIARRYAKALFDLATTQSQVVKFQDQLHWMNQATEQVPDLLSTLSNERTPLAKRLAVVDGLGQALGLDPLVTQFCKVLIEKRRIHCWNEVVKSFAAFAAKAVGVLQVGVTTAVPLANSDITERLTQVLSQLTKKTVDLQMSVDENLIGGAVVQIDDTIYDGSIANDLRKLKERLEHASII